MFKNHISISINQSTRNNYYPCVNVQGLLQKFYTLKTRHLLSSNMSYKDSMDSDSPSNDGSDSETSQFSINEDYKSSSSPVHGIYKKRVLFSSKNQNLRKNKKTQKKHK